MKVWVLFIIGVFTISSEALGQEKISNQADTTIVKLSEFDIESSSYISLEQLRGWKYNPGHNPEFSNPEYNDSDWSNLTLQSDSLLAAKDSLWKGHGWFRLTFQVDSLFYEIPRALSFRAFGAAEIYLDGRKIDTYGVPSTSPESEVMARILPNLFPVMGLNPSQKHVLAIRYSFHNFENLKKLSYSGNMDIGAHVHIHTVKENVSDYQSKLKERAAFIIALAVLLMITILHLIFYFKFPEDASNFWVFLISLHLAIIAAILILFRFFEIRGSWQLLSHYFISYAYFQFFSMIPIALCNLLKTEKYSLWKYLPAAGVILALTHFLFLKFVNAAFANLLPVVIAGLVLVAGIFIIWGAKNHNQKNIWIISIGFLSLPVIVLITIFVSIIALTNSGSASDGLLLYFTISIILAFLTFPVCMSIYVGSIFFDLYGNLESSVKERTRELNEKNKKLESANKKIKEQRDEVVKARNNLQNALDDLKATQKQLIQQEKLASLGQLTAGIAHEIKNPLNFVNNFSELSVELIEEAREELQSEKAKGKREKIEEALEILNDIEMNLKKIHEHGTRADSIVKSMLQHSRGGSGKMEPTGLNSLVKEYVNLSFHGMRAGKDPINVDMEFDLDQEISEVPLIAEDFSRVIVNLCNNAFDAMREKLSAVDEKNYSPKLVIRTFKKNQAIFVEIADNGPGISESIKDKILQPFFTTKKGTEGTGLGLSITNDIIKAHGGFLEVSTNQNEGTSFTIKLSQGG
ncbi:MAG: ATP-binding protein [Gracilimonas sp.]